MKKIHSILLFYILALLAGCSDSDENLSVTTLKVIKSDVEFSMEGGNGSIVVEALQPVEAVSNASWCKASVSGTTINLTVEPNMSIEARNTLVIISSGNEKVQVGITQMGELADCNMEGKHVFSLMGGTADFEVNTYRAYTVTCEGGDGWLTFTDDKKGKVRVQIAPGAYNLETKQTATVTVAIGANKWTATFEQLPLAGEYIFQYNRDNKLNEGVCRLDITDTPDTYDVRFLSGVPITNGGGLPGKAIFANGKLAFPMGSQLLGYMNVDGSTLPLYLYAYCKVGSIGFSDELQYIAPLAINAENQLELTFGDNGMWSEDGSLTVDGFYYACLKDGKIAKNWGAMTDVVMIHKD